MEFLFRMMLPALGQALGRVLSRKRVHLLLALLFFTASAFFPRLSPGTLRAIYSFAFGQGIYLVFQSLMLLGTIFLTTVFLSGSSLANRVEVWNPYFSKALLLGNLLLVLGFALYRPEGEVFLAAVKWALVANFCLNAVLDLLAKVTPAMAGSFFRVHVISIIALPLAMLPAFLTAILFSIFQPAGALLGFSQDGVNYQITINIAGWYFLLQVFEQPWQWGESIFRALGEPRGDESADE